MARPEAAVVDASVAAKWFLPETDTGAALRLRERHVSGELRLVAPDLLVYEVANALRYHPRVGSERWSDHIEDLFALDIGFDPASETSMQGAVEAAFRLGVSVYDATYVALAERLDTAVYTADDHLLRAAGDRGQHIRAVRSTR